MRNDKQRMRLCRHWGSSNQSRIAHRASPSIPPPKLPILLQSALPARLRLSVTLLLLLSFVRSHGRHAGGPVPRLISLVSNTTLDACGRCGQRGATQPRTSLEAPGFHWGRCLRPTVSWEPQSVPSAGICQCYELVFYVRWVFLVDWRLYPTHNTLIFLRDAFGLGSNRSR